MHFIYHGQRPFRAKGSVLTCNLLTSAWCPDLGGFQSISYHPREQFNRRRGFPAQASVEHYNNGTTNYRNVFTRYYNLFSPSAYTYFVNEWAVRDGILRVFAVFGSVAAGVMTTMPVVYVFGRGYRSSWSRHNLMTKLEIITHEQ